MRLIDADALKLSHCKECTLYPNNCLGDDCDWESIAHINMMPTIDAVPVVRCRDCKWYEKDIGCDWGVCFHDDWTHRNVGHGVEGDGYCYRAEKK